jgi:glutathione synthase/RimK-type ligase-like ATP-grasp enzyme
MPYSTQKLRPPHYYHRSTLLIKQAAENLGAKFELIDKHSGGFAKITLNKKSLYFGVGPLSTFPLNKAINHRIAKDKAWTYMLLEQNGIKIPKGSYFFPTPPKTNTIRNSSEMLWHKKKGKPEALNLAQELGYPVFVKPNSLSQGKHCALIKSKSELKTHLNTIWEEDGITIIQKPCRGKEYRIGVLNDEIIICYQKTAAKNSHTANLSTGGTATPIEKNINHLLPWIKRITSIMQLQYYAIDFFDSSNLNDPNQFEVIEINSNPSCANYFNFDPTKTISLYEKLIKTAFT